MKEQATMTAKPAGAEVAHANLNRKFGMWLFLSSELLIFAGLIGAFVLTRRNIFQNGLEWWEPNTFSLALVSVNTFILLASSLMVVLGIEAIRADQQQKLQRYLTLTAILGVMFLSGQAVEYSLLIFEEGHSFADPFGSAFFTLTGIHGLHVFVGVIWCLMTLLVARRGTFSSRNYTTVEIFGLYWHFVDLIWVIIFTVVYLTN
ncbi:MAG: heme-copper oxidase subunit III [Chloroflexi bacterium]|nr:heme-copper oxidase subunit III [Chloroflexota bacterium]